MTTGEPPPRVFKVIAQGRRGPALKEANDEQRQGEMDTRLHETNDRGQIHGGTLFEDELVEHLGDKDGLKPKCHPCSTVCHEVAIMLVLVRCPAQRIIQREGLEERQYDVDYTRIHEFVHLSW